ncbi:hypothetical protein L873DRAFT_1455511 [Choiromyces venosus 120613-1]|uniref:Uncharacterized protein n=1 Tax=Choiromyces venosus 120613-1 TaxID=1336337 RepID=A0A3N4K3W8_9PEZI|nr:hypothetical protein L873DRAFT_1455511 [Choiromyces venosus 120613-1]
MIIWRENYNGPSVGPREPVVILFVRNLEMHLAGFLSRSKASLSIILVILALFYLFFFSLTSACCGKYRWVQDFRRAIVESLLFLRVAFMYVTVWFETKITMQDGKMPMYSAALVHTIRNLHLSSLIS